ncbi:MAG: NHL repeat-containing protein [Candidatus Micrarchaeota archaeon]
MLVASVLLFGCLTPNPAPTPTPSAAPTSAPTNVPSAPPSLTEQGCIASGGTVTTANCCSSIGDFPNTCAIGACGCAPQYSHSVKICGCGDKCFNGDTCVTFKEGEGIATATPTTGASASSDRFVWIAGGDGKVSKLYESNGTFAGHYAAGAVPVSIAVDAEGNVWVADGSDFNEGNGEVTKLDSTGELIGTYKTGSAHSRVVLDPSGNVWVLDIGDKIEKLSPNGTVLGQFTALMDPLDIIADSYGNVWVTGTHNGNGNLVKLNSAGEITGEYDLEAGAAMMAIDSEGNLLVAGNKMNNVTRVSSEGGILGKYTISAIAMAVDADGNIWTTNAGNTIKKYDSGGGIIGEYPVGEAAIGVSIDYDGNVWVSNTESSFVTKLNGATGALIGNYEIGGCEWNVGDATGFRYHHFVLRDD